jgi:hypothetical protein
MPFDCVKLSKSSLILQLLFGVTYISAPLRNLVVSARISEAPAEEVFVCAEGQE